MIFFAGSIYKVRQIPEHLVTVTLISQMLLVFKNDIELKTEQTRNTKHRKRRN